MLIQRAVSLGKVVQTRGFGGTARFTLPGMETRRKKIGPVKTLYVTEEAQHEAGKNSGDEAEEERFDKEEEAEKEPGTTSLDEKEPGTTSPDEKEPGTTSLDEKKDISGLYLAEQRAGLGEQLKKEGPITRSRLTLC